MTVRLNRLSDLGKDFTKQMKKARQQLAEMPDVHNKPIFIWLTLPPSVNKMYATVRSADPGKRPKRRLTTEARAWKTEAESIVFMEARAQHWACTQHSKVVVEVTAYFPDDGRKHDMNNLHKALADALEGSIYANDRMALLRDMDFHVTKGQPKVELKIYQVEEDESI